MPNQLNAKPTSSSFLFSVAHVIMLTVLVYCGLSCVVNDNKRGQWCLGQPDLPNQNGNIIQKIILLNIASLLS